MVFGSARARRFVSGRWAVGGGQWIWAEEVACRSRRGEGERKGKEGVEEVEGVRAGWRCSPRSRRRIFEGGGGSGQGGASIVILRERVRCPLDWAL